jgi:ribosomal protein L11 methyltransferase
VARTHSNPGYETALRTLSRVARLVRIVVDGADAELAADVLWAAAPSAVHEELLRDGRVRLTADPADPGMISARWDTELLDVDGDAYLDAWRAWARPVRIGRIVVQPTWIAAEEPAQHDIVVHLDPGRAFGSGSHPSTRLAVAALQEWTQTGDGVLDVGCGSGVLAITAARLGARQVVALDVDPDARAATVANARANDVGEVVSVTSSPLHEVGGRFDVVVANISAAFLIDTADHIGALVAAGGVLLLAGMLEEQEPAVAAAYGSFTLVTRAVEDGWAAAVLRAT